MGKIPTAQILADQPNQVKSLQWPLFIARWMTSLHSALRNAAPPNRVAQSESLSFLSHTGGGPANAMTATELKERLIQRSVTRIFQQSLDMKPNGRHHGRAEQVKRARNDIEDHLKETILLGQVAEQAGVSIRTLKLSFRSFLGVTPFEYIRTRRLKKIRQHLLDQNPDKPSLADLAIRHALFHLGRFSGDDKALFDELPSETLARSRGFALTGLAGTTDVSKCFICQAPEPSFTTADCLFCATASAMVEGEHTTIGCGMESTCTDHENSGLFSTLVISGGTD